MSLLDNLTALVILNHLEEVDLRQHGVSLFIRGEFREVFEVVSGPSDKNDIFHVLLAEFVFGHGPSQQKVIE
jgi:hypothetical protein